MSPMPEVPTPYDVYVVGTGTVGCRQFTREAEAALARSERVYLVHDQHLVENYIADELGTEVIRLAPAVAPGDREAAGRCVADRVLDRAESVDDPVSVALVGHPVVRGPGRRVIDGGRDRGLAVTVVPGISSIDCLCADVGLDPAERGIQVFEGADLLDREIGLDSRVPAVILGVDATETVPGSTGDEAERDARFCEYLRRFYPDDHTVYLVKTARYASDETERIPVALAELGDVRDRTGRAGTLYLPARGERGTEADRADWGDPGVFIHRPRT